MENIAGKKIIFLVPIFGGGGGEKVVSDLTMHLPESVQKIIVAFENKNYYPYNGKFISMDIPLSTNFFSKVLIFLKGYIKFKNILRKEKPDYVMSFGSLQNILNIVSTKKSIVRVDNPILVTHAGFMEKAYPWLVGMLFNRAAKIMVVSEGLKKELVEKFNIVESKISVVYNAVDVGKIRELAGQPLEPKYQEIFNHPIVINIGTLIGQKGQSHLIKAFVQLKKEVKDAQLIILGEGPLEGQLKKLVKELNLENGVHFLGWQKNPFKFLARSKVFALPSLWEGFGIVILEAMALQVPVVAFDCNFGPREILAPELDPAWIIKDIEYAKNGVLLPLPGRPGHQGMLTKALVDALTNKVLRLSTIGSALERVKDFNLENFLQNYKFLWDK